MSVVVECVDVHRTFGELHALDGLSLRVDEGEIFCIVGPNGAGKTTLLNCLEGLDAPTLGWVRVLGLHPIEDSHRLTARVGVQLQSAALPPRLTVGEALELYAALYIEPRPWRDLLHQLGIGDKAGERVERLSGGERQRVFIALALIHQPELAFLDELTTALDPQSRRDMWDTVEQVRADGATVVLTTHYMEEAERLCDRVAIVDHGRLVAMDSVPALIARHAGAPIVRITLAVPAPPDLDPGSLPGVTRGQVAGNVLHLEGDPTMTQRVLAELSERGLAVTDMRTSNPGLEDVFLALTGRSMPTAEEAAS